MKYIYTVEEKTTPTEATEVMTRRSVFYNRQTCRQYVVSMRDVWRQEGIDATTTRYQRLDGYDPVRGRTH